MCSLLVALVFFTSPSGCAYLDGFFGTRPDEGVALRMSDLLYQGDAARRASQSLVVDGLDADIQGQLARAQGEYERAIQVDPTNPYAYLALARQYVERGQPERALALLDQTDSLLVAQGAKSPRVVPHLAGLRGEALYSSGRSAEAISYLEQARRLAPDVWADGTLRASELR